MKATITFEDNAETGDIDVTVEFHGPIDRLSDAHRTAAAMAQALKSSFEEDDDE